MCEATAYVVRNGQEEMIFEGVDIMVCEGDTLKIRTMFGEKVELKARIKSLLLVENKIILEPL